ncbi:hypothetical protein ACFY71_35915 [Streptomyces cinerochromogenes]|uniref:hypothetical protein n=1 Tax=Streptomyces cinerochromogenes TaxID=66422 RepID=UPI0036742EE4
MIVQTAGAGLLIQLGHTVTETHDGCGLVVLAEAVLPRGGKGIEAPARPTYWAPTVCVCGAKSASLATRPAGGATPHAGTVPTRPLPAEFAPAAPRFTADRQGRR